jgi:hypothetical protein
MRYALEMHPESRCAAVSGIDVFPVPYKSGRLRLRYIVNGVISNVQFPPPTEPGRADELWRHTCFELFLQAPGSAAYWEFNFSPSGQWAAYQFTGYRAGMRPFEPLVAPTIEIQTEREQFAMVVTLDRTTLGLPPNGVWRAGLSAIIEGMAEDRDSHTSWWALAHPPGKPDFHHACNFALDLPAEE